MPELLAALLGTALLAVLALVLLAAAAPRDGARDNPALWDEPDDDPWPD